MRESRTIPTSVTLALGVQPVHGNSPSTTPSQSLNNSLMKSTQSVRYRNITRKDIPKELPMKRQGRERGSPVSTSINSEEQLSATDRSGNTPRQESSQAGN